MPITESQLKKRGKTLGSSDMAAIMGFDPWKNAHDIWLEKIHPMNPIKNNAAIDLGNYLEPGLINYAEDQLGKMKRNQFRRLAGTPLAANMDAVLIAPDEPVEAKTNSLVVPDFLRQTEDWGDEGTDDVPERVIIQCHVHMLCLNAKLCHVTAVVGGKGMILYRIIFNDTIAHEVVTQAETFWKDCVVGGNAPAVSPNYETVRRIIRPVGKVAPMGTINEDDFARWDRINEAKKAVVKAERFAKAKMISQLGDAEYSKLSNGRTVKMNHIQTKGHTVQPTSYYKCEISRRKAIKN